MNAPDKFSLFTLPAGCKKIDYEADTKSPNAGTFTIHKEDHTLGNLLRMQLLRDKRVLFAGYRVPHPLEYYILLKVQTTPETTPKVALENALYGLHTEFNSLEEMLRTEVLRKRSFVDQQ